MEQNVFKEVAQNNNVSEEEVRNEIALALSLTKDFKTGEDVSLEEMISVLAGRVIEAMGAE